MIVKMNYATNKKNLEDKKHFYGFVECFPLF